MKLMMSNKYSILEFIVIGIALTGLLFHSQHLPGASIIFIIGISSIALFYFFRQKDHALAQTKVAMAAFSYRIGSIGLTVLMVGILFRWQHWPGAEVQLLAGIGTMIIAIVLILIFRSKLGQDDPLTNKLTGLFYRCIAWGSIGVLLYLTPVRDLIEFQHSDDPEYAKIFIEVVENPGDTAAYSRLLEYQDKKWGPAKEE